MLVVARFFRRMKNCKDFNYDAHQNLIDNRKAWSDYFDGSCTEYDSKTTRLTSFNSFAYVKNSKFEGIYTKDSGGAILWTDASDKKNIDRRNSVYHVF